MHLAQRANYSLSLQGTVAHRSLSSTQTYPQKQISISPECSAHCMGSKLKPAYKNTKGTKFLRSITVKTRTFLMAMRKRERSRGAGCCCSSGLKLGQPSTLYLLKKKSHLQPKRSFGGRIRQDIVELFSLLVREQQPATNQSI